MYSALHLQAAATAATELRHQNGDVALTEQEPFATRAVYVSVDLPTPSPNNH